MDCQISLLDYGNIHRYVHKIVSESMCYMCVMVLLCAGTLLWTDTLNNKICLQ
jgi:hypothetical protein